MTAITNNYRKASKNERGELGEHDRLKLKWDNGQLQTARTNATNDRYE